MSKSNGKRGAPEGNDNAGDGKRWREALRRALARSGGTVDKGLDKAADQLVAAAVKGQGWALEHIAERFDGKATQVIHATVEHTVSTGDQAELEARLRPATPAVDRTVQ